MATIHPSRLGLIPQNNSDKHRRRSSSPSRDSRRRSRSRSRDRRPRSPERKYQKSSSSPRRTSRGRDDGTKHRGRDGRGSPEYQDYRKPPPENMYPNRQGGEFDRSAGMRGAGSSDFLESRRLKREANTEVNVWPPSPRASARSLSPRRGKSSKKSKRARSPSTSDSSSSEDERRRRKKKEKKRRKERDREYRKEKRRRSRSARSRDDRSDEERPRRSRRHSRSRSPAQERHRHSASPPPESIDDDWVVKDTPGALLPRAVPPTHGGDRIVEANRSTSMDDDVSDEEVGPRPVVESGSSRIVDERAYGGSLLRGEGSAMAAFLLDDPDSRIPRRGEIGLTSDEIATYEDAGYVMSGSRHRRMNAVRMRKENQVISAEEKRNILKLQREEKERREAILREEFTELVNERLKGTETKPRP